MIENRKVSFSPPDISEIEINEVIDTLKSGWITTGPKTKRFEQLLADFCNTKRVATLNSATAAMELTLRLLGVGPGDEVITCAYTYSASASVITHVGAKVVLVDSGVDSFHINYDAIADAITEKTKVIIPVDIGGVMCDYDEIFNIVEAKKDLFNPTNALQKKIGRVIVLADAAHSLGASYKGMMSGKVADFTSFSFHAVKNLTTGEGGAVTWKPIDGVDDEEIYKQYMVLSLHGQSKDALAKTQIGAWEYDIIAPNYKCNMTDIMSSIGIGQLSRYPGLLMKRLEIVSKYDDMLNECDITSLKHIDESQRSCAHLYMIRLNGQDEKTRNEVIRKMAEMGVSTNVHYKPLPLHSAYRNLGFDIADFPNSLAMYKNEITLPLHTLLTDSDVEFVVKALKKALGHEVK